MKMNSFLYSESETGNTQNWIYHAIAGIINELNHVSNFQTYGKASLPKAQYKREKRSETPIPLECLEDGSVVKFSIYELTKA